LDEVEKKPCLPAETKKPDGWQDHNNLITQQESKFGLEQGTTPQAIGNMSQTPVSRRACFLEYVPATHLAVKFLSSSSCPAVSQICSLMFRPATAEDGTVVEENHAHESNDSLQ